MIQDIKGTPGVQRQLSERGIKSVFFGDFRLPPVMSAIWVLRRIRQQGNQSKDLLSADAVGVKGSFEWLFKGNPVHARPIRLFPVNRV